MQSERPQLGIAGAVVACVLGVIPAATGVRGIPMYAFITVAVIMLIVTGVALGGSRARD